MPAIWIDGREYEVGEGRNLLQAALDNDLDLPYFCWHPAMGSVGACRLCAVKQYRDETDEQGQLAMGCLMPAAEGTRVSISDPEAAQFRRSVIEWLMINHPHDCPICDEGGECHLQDMTVMAGHAHRRYRGRKRTFRNQYLGPLIHHEMNRCIQCYRCVRFYCDHTGGHDLGAFASRDRVYFGRVEEGVLESPFAGNLVEVCPTGVFTDKPFRRHFTRKWDLQSAPSICVHCGLGCNTLPAARYGDLRRVTTRYNGEVNGYWLCDRGRFGYEHANAADRLVRPHRRAADGSGAEPQDWQSSWEAASADVARAAAAGKLAGVGSPRASLESNFALRSLVDPDRFNPGLADAERRLVWRYASAAAAAEFHVPSLREIENADAVVVLGSDLTNEAPLLDLALYRALSEKGAQIFVADRRRGRVCEFAAASLYLDPDTCAAVGRAVAASAANSGVADRLEADARSFAERAAEALAAAQRPLVITGTLHRHPGILDACLTLAATLGDREQGPLSMALAVPEANSVGTVVLDENRGPGLEELLTSIEADQVTALVVCENDLFDRCEQPERLAAALDRLESLVVLDHMVTSTAALATSALPVATTPESNGSLVNNEGRIQRFYEVLAPPEAVMPAWAWLRDLAAELPGGEAPAQWQHVESVTEAMAEAHPLLAAATEVAPPAGFRQQHQRIPRMPHRFSGRNAMPDRTDLRQHARPPRDDETPFAYSMEGFSGATPPALLSRVWAPGWNSNEAINQFQIEVGGPLHGGDPGRRIFPAAATTGRPGIEETPASQNGGADGELLLCATAEIFGSETMSRRSPAIAELAPPPYLLMNPDDAERLGVAGGATYRLKLCSGDVEREATLTVDADASVPRGTAAVPAGYPETRWWQAPHHVRVDVVEQISGGDAP